MIIWNIEQSIKLSLFEHPCGGRENFVDMCRPDLGKKFVNKFMKIGFTDFESIFGEKLCRETLKFVVFEACKLLWSGNILQSIIVSSLIELNWL